MSCLQIVKKFCSAVIDMKVKVEMRFLKSGCQSTFFYKSGVLLMLGKKWKWQVYSNLIEIRKYRMLHMKSAQFFSKAIFHCENHLLLAKHLYFHTSDYKIFTASFSIPDNNGQNSYALKFSKQKHKLSLLCTVGNLQVFRR